MPSSSPRRIKALSLCLPQSRATPSSVDPSLRLGPQNDGKHVRELMSGLVISERNEARNSRTALYLLGIAAGWLQGWVAYLQVPGLCLDRIMYRTYRDISCLSSFCLFASTFLITFTCHLLGN
ncbi:hypothetical protein M431DRAFT_373396 [Trichoderma harzianum CBS 226.95]|uniref:Uncharacterized protein n=1 Tax=Trichoderma harzianum CBS 226.95 TaxID=983964 RepID=A0A2T4AHE8_TRIHA|nr:hypothetical protein M431DRAFT_373396 [Trichoderma harzianum CBS 226.95]PTB56338.1 hypothetical protein M431DRAFT_373396 [Trichoderma harzianum CBS 226.95]